MVRVVVGIPIRVQALVHVRLGADLVAHRGATRATDWVNTSDVGGAAVASSSGPHPAMKSTATTAGQMVLMTDRFPRRVWAAVRFGHVVSAEALRAE